MCLVFATRYVTKSCNEQFLVLMALEVYDFVLVGTASYYESLSLQQKNYKCVNVMSSQFAMTASCLLTNCQRIVYFK